MLRVQYLDSKPEVTVEGGGFEGTHIRKWTGDGVADPEWEGRMKRKGKNTDSQICMRAGRWIAGIHRLVWQNVEQMVGVGARMGQLALRD